ncbi:MAG: hypothetical protein ACRDNS_23140, partial [Trebonia sp.]
VNESYSCDDYVGEPCVGNSDYGPAITVTGAVDNDGGVITIANAYGSFFQNGTVLGQQVNVNVPNGAAVISLPSADPYVAGSPNPFSEWENYMIWPGGDPGAGTVCDNTGCHQTSAGTQPNADHALVWAINSQDSGSDGSDSALNYALYHWGPDGTSNPNDKYSRPYSVIYYGNCFPFEGGDCSGGTESGLTPTGKTTNNTSDGDAPLPLIPSTADGYSLGETIANYPSSVSDNSSSAIFGNRVTIQGAWIDLDTNLTAGQPTSWSLVLPSSLSGACPAFPFPLGGCGAISYDRELYQDFGFGPTFDLPVDAIAGTSEITAKYDAAANQIIVNNVGAASGGAFVSLDGGIVNTNTIGQIHVNGGFGSVQIDNQTGVPLQLQRIFTGASDG